MGGPVFSEEEVIGRIDAFRRRRPRLKDEIVTLLEGGEEAFKQRRIRYAY